MADVLHDAEPELVARWKHEQEAKAAAKAAAAAAKAERKRRRQEEAKGERGSSTQAKRRGVANAFHDAEAKRAAVSKHEQEATKRRRIDQLPEWIGPELIAACLDASRRIRLDDNTIMGIVRWSWCAMSAS